MNVAFPVLVPQTPLLLPAPSEDRLVVTIIEETTADLAEIVDLEQRRHSFLHHKLGRIYERAHIIDARRGRRGILVRRLRSKLGTKKCARWGVAGRATHELLLKIAAPTMIKETKYQHHRKLTSAKKAGVAPSEAAYVAWADAQTQGRKKAKKAIKATNGSGTSQPTEPQPYGDADPGKSPESGKVRFQRALDEFAWTVPEPGGEDPVVRISTPRRERFPEKVGVMIFRETDDSQIGLVRDVYQLGVVTDYDAVADALHACLKERDAHWKAEGRLQRKKTDQFLQTVRAHRQRYEGWEQPEPAPYTQAQIDAASGDERLWMEVMNEEHAKEEARRGFGPMSDPKQDAGQATEKSLDPTPDSPQVEVTDAEQ